MPAIASLAGRIWRACYPGIISDAQIDYMLARMYSLETLTDEIQSQGIRFECFFAGDTFIGFASFGPTNDRSVFKLHKLYLNPEWHGRGFGSRLLGHCENVAANLGARRLILNVNKNNTKAIQTYERNGFRIVESVVNDIGGGFVMDDFVMAKDLPFTRTA